MAIPLRILLVEDSERDAALLKLCLKRGGYDAELHRVDTRVELDAQLRAAPWDLVVSDFNLPGFDAFATIEAVGECGGGVPLVVLSADVDPAVMAGIAAAGVRYVPKYEMRQIVPIVDELMRDRA